MRSIFSNNYLDNSILSTGFIDWNPSRYNNYTLQGEYHDFGPGFNATGRKISNFTVQLTAAQFKPYSSAYEVFQFPNSSRIGNDAWIDYTAWEMEIFFPSFFDLIDK